MRRFHPGFALPGLIFLLTSCDSHLPPQPEVSGTEVAADAASGEANSFLGGPSEARNRRGYDLAPVPLDVRGKNPNLVGLGSYLVHTHACSDCHTSPPFAPGGNPFAGEPEQTNTEGYLAGGAQFGPFTSRNITPRANGLPGGLTLEQFMLVMREGVDFRPDKPLLQVMPWPFFKDMTDQELRAIYEYLRAIPCVARADQSPERCTG